MTLNLGERGPLILSSPTPFVLAIGLNRPEARNAVNDSVASALSDTMEDLDHDDHYRVAVLYGVGRGFCAGLDLKAHLAGETAMHPDRGFAGITRRGPSKPIIAAVEGFALAGGLEIALACDLLVAAEDARLGLPEVQRGLMADGGALLHLPQRIAFNSAMELALTGDPMPVPRLHQLGLVNRIAPTGGALKEATELAAKIARNAPLAVAASKKVVQDSRDWPLSEAWENQDTLARPVWSSEDAEEGARAFIERREPDFIGR